MIRAHCFSADWLDQFRKQKDHSRIDKIILEKMIYALDLVGHLRQSGLDFVLKGGTCLVLLVEEANRFSIDIDIIIRTDQKELETILDEVVERSHFTGWKMDEHRSYQPGVPKAHYKLSFKTDLQDSGTVLLDVLFEDYLYPYLVEKPIAIKWIESDTETLVVLPSIDSITGDKLTAFAPNTIGIPYFKGVDKQPFSMEICKQLFDLSKLFERIESMNTVAESFNAFAVKEIAYRKNESSDSVITPDAVLQDIIDTCVIITKRGSGSDDQRMKFNELLKGIKAFGTGFLMSGNFRIEDAVSAAARIAYMSAKIMLNDLTPIDYFKGQNINDWQIEDPDWSFLNRLKRQQDKSSYYYWYLTVNLIQKSQ